MSEKYPHLKDTPFPHVESVDAYAYQNNYDYSKYSANGKIKLCNVPYNSTYSDVVEWDTNKARDNYFDNLNGEVADLPTPFLQLAQDKIKVPVPIDKALTYNYCYIDVPKIPNNAQPLDYQNGELVSRVYYFIDDVRPLAPSTSELALSVDVWTTYYKSIAIGNATLERGHFGLSKSNVSDYLSNPLAHSDWLLAPDVNFGDFDFVKSNKFELWGDGKKYILFATPMTAAQITSASAAGAAQPTTAATYSDASGRTGYQYNVANYNFGQGGKTYSSMPTAAQNYISSDKTTPNGAFVYGVQCTQAQAFLHMSARAYRKWRKL